MILKVMNWQKTMNIFSDINGNEISAAEQHAQQCREKLFQCLEKDVDYFEREPLQDDPMSSFKSAKYVLKKPGAEAICNNLGITVRYGDPVFSTIVQPNGDSSSVFTVKAMAYKNDQLLAEGVSSRCINIDGGDVNKTSKMAFKSAHIDVVLRATAMDRYFTQDIAEPVSQPEKVNQQTGLQACTDQNKIELVKEALGNRSAIVAYQYDRGRIEDLTESQIDDVMAIEELEVNAAPHNSQKVVQNAPAEEPIVIQLQSSREAMPGLQL